jgi:hypothetical protein
MEQQDAQEEESEPAGHRAREQRSAERDALRRRVRESLLRCPGGDTQPRV